MNRLRRTALALACSPSNKVRKMEGFAEAVRRERASARVAELARGHITAGTRKTYLPSQRKFLRCVLAHYNEDVGIGWPSHPTEQSELINSLLSPVSSANSRLVQLLDCLTEEIVSTFYQELVDTDGAGSTVPKTARSAVFNLFSDTGVRMPDFMRSVLIKNMFQAYRRVSLHSHSIPSPGLFSAVARTLD
ncbi:hypothetical protein FVE85_9374 [Porphyridium purpureum]|uniref:Uncharacterized protein n=1 Tax=Porphyridium purpureum TaxID=35688 RepID=A0A5J4YQN0_PORPP|nr:hypothetical protein FVE85_9374 [Porphyridium purpureum]|eukprot:POR2157..scf222_8